MRSDACIVPVMEVARRGISMDSAGICEREVAVSVRYATVREMVIALIAAVLYVTTVDAIELLEDRDEVR